MPYEIAPDQDKRLVVIRISGDVTLAEVRGIVADLLGRVEVSGFRQLVDLRELNSATAISAADIRAIAAGAMSASPMRAVVASDSATFGLARMFAALRNLKDSGDQIGVFRTMREAEDWLGLSAV